jgi:PilZ domain
MPYFKKEILQMYDKYNKQLQHQRRAYKRWRTDSMARVRHDGHDYVGRFLDISPNGALLSSLKPLAVGSEVTLIIRSSDDSMDEGVFTGKVTRYEPDRIMPKIAIEFNMTHRFDMPRSIIGTPS